MNTDMQIFPNFVLFTNGTSKVNVEVYFYNQTLRLTQKNMAKLFDVDISTVNEHLHNIYKTWELSQELTFGIFPIVQIEWNVEKKREIKFYSLKAIIAVWYRVNSHIAINFRKRATETLQEFMIKGYILDSERLKQVKHFGQDYFDEILEKIREIRLSERRFYQKITDIYALSADYDKDDEKTQLFFATVQNKLHWAITGQTAAELIYSEADAKKIYMWLKTRKNSPDGFVLKSDVSIAKNYLNQEHLKELEGLVSAYLELAENMAKRHIVMNMSNWISVLDDFLALSQYPILLDNWKISALKAKLKAESEFEKYRIIQDKAFESDFDKFVEETMTKKLK